MDSRKSPHREGSAALPIDRQSGGPASTGAAARHAVGNAMDGGGPADAGQTSEWLDERTEHAKPPPGTPISTQKQADAGRAQALESRRGSHR